MSKESFGSFVPVEEKRNVIEDIDKAIWYLNKLRSKVAENLDSHEQENV